MTPELANWGDALSRLPGIGRAIVYGSSSRRPNESRVLSIALDTACKVGFASHEDMSLVRAIQGVVEASRGDVQLCLLFTDAIIVFSGCPARWERSPDPTLKTAVRLGQPFSSWWASAAQSGPAPFSCVLA